MEDHGGAPFYVTKEGTEDVVKVDGNLKTVNMKT